MNVAEVIQKPEFGVRIQGAHAFGKRLFDIVFSLVGLLVFLPFGLAIALLIKLTDRGPVFFRQVRVGFEGRQFRILKFRTMYVGADKAGPAVTKDRDPRITGIGRILRRTKLDEMPQLWNVLTGEMSFVGPRPEVPRYVERYTEEQRQLLQLKPGITDLATLMFRNEEALLRNAPDVEDFYMRHCVPRKFNLNMQYARRATLSEDIFLILQTLCPYWLAVGFGYSLLLAVSLWVSYFLRFEFSIPANEYVNLWKLGPGVVLLQLGFLFWRRHLSGLLSYFDLVEMKGLAAGLIQVCAVCLIIWGLSGGQYMPGRSILIIDCVVAFVLLSITRVQLRSWRERHRGHLDSGDSDSSSLRVGIIGAGEVGGWLLRQLARGRRQRRVVAFFDDDPQKWHRHLCGVEIVGMPECLLDGAWEGRLDEVILAMPEATPERKAEVSALLTRLGVRTRSMPSVEEWLER